MSNPASRDPNGPMGSGHHASGAPKLQNRLLFLIAVAAAILASTLLILGWDYYFLDISQRPFSPRHGMLKPSGTVGLRLGILGLFILASVFLYPLRKHWPYLSRFGKTRNWFNIHVLLGLCLPVVITFHSTFKMQGFAGMAYWTMIGLVGSGIIGRYLYAQIPRNIKAAELSLKETEELRATLTEGLKTQTIFPQSGLESLFPLPGDMQIRDMSLLPALARMVMWDMERPFRVWALRRRGMHAKKGRLFAGGLLTTHNPDLERTIVLASRQAALSKRILFLSKTHRVFHLWHIIHRPFSISLAVFVIIHVTVVTWLGYY